jgi:hypothetical protein
MAVTMIAARVYQRASARFCSGVFMVSDSLPVL